MYKDKNGNLHVPYMGGEVVLRSKGQYQNEEGKLVSFEDAIKFSRGSIVSVIPFEVFAAIVDADQKDPEVHAFLTAHGINLKHGLI